MIMRQIALFLISVEEELAKLDGGPTWIEQLRPPYA